MASILTGNKFDPAKDIPDLTGKVFVVTGGTAGIGFGISANILQHNPEKLYLLGKKEDHGKEAQDELQKYGDVSKVEFIQCELEDFRRTDEVARTLMKLDRIDALVLNAGLGVGVYNETKDGVDSHMLLKTPNSRIVLQSSDLHRGASSDTKFASIVEINQDIGAARLYNRSKASSRFYLHESLVSRLQKGQFDASPEAFSQHGPWINSVHPGGVSTDQQKQAEDAYGTLGKIGVAVVRPFHEGPVEEGCRPALFAATSGDVVQDKIQGQYIVPDRKVTEPSTQAQDDQLAENLWRLSMTILEETLGKQDYMSN